MVAGGHDEDARAHARDVVQDFQAIAYRKEDSRDAKVDTCCPNADVRGRVACAPSAFPLCADGRTTSRSCCSSWASTARPDGLRTHHLRRTRRRVSDFVQVQLDRHHGPRLSSVPRERRELRQPPCCGTRTTGVHEAHGRYPGIRRRIRCRPGRAPRALRSGPHEILRPEASPKVTPGYQDEGLAGKRRIPSAARQTIVRPTTCARGVARPGVSWLRPGISRCSLERTQKV